MAPRRAWLVPTAVRSTQTRESVLITTDMFAGHRQPRHLPLRAPSPLPHYNERGGGFTHTKYSQGYTLPRKIRENANTERQGHIGRAIQHRKTRDAPPQGAGQDTTH